MTPAAEAILARAWDDWVSLGEAQHVVSDLVAPANSEELREATIGTVALLLQRDLILVGDVFPRFTAWDLDTTSVIERIRSGWTDPDARLLPGDICWLAGTAAGIAVGDRVLARGEKQQEM